MDPFTHILFGNACALGATRRPVRMSRQLARRIPVATAAALFPDLDYLGFWIDPLVFLADWHRAYTHSLVLLPFWAGVVTLPFLLFSTYRSAWREVYLVACLVLASHIFLDLTTVYGTQIFAPLSDTRYSFAITFVVDLLVTLPLLLALVMSRWLPPRPVVAVCFLYLGGYWSAQYVLQRHTLERVAVTDPADGALFALPQPFSPFNWKLIQETQAGYRMAYLNLLAEENKPGWLERLGLPVAEYRSPKALQWEVFTRFGERVDRRDIVQTAWQLPRFAPFRRFAASPASPRSTATISVPTGSASGSPTCVTPCRSHPLRFATAPAGRAQRPHGVSIACADLKREPGNPCCQIDFELPMGCTWDNRPFHLGLFHQGLNSRDSREGEFRCFAGRWYCYCP